MKWDELKKPMERGSMRLKSFVDMNKALQGKWLWRFASEEMILWSRVIEACWGREVGGRPVCEMVRSHGMGL